MTEKQTQLMQEYLALIGAELSELAILAHIRGWSSSRAEEGIRLRGLLIAEGLGDIFKK